MRMTRRMLIGSFAALISLTAAAFPYAQADAAASVEAQRAKVVATALELQDKVKYVHWQDRQESYAPYKTDCSGFTYLVYRLANVGVKLINRDDDDQSHVGKLVTWGNFEKGDLLFFWNDPNNKGNVGHVGIYIGNGRMIHNADIGKDVVISDVNMSYYKTRFIVARRVIY